MSGDGSIMRHRHGFVKALSAFLRDRCRVQGGERLVLAVSGGADSVALLHALAALAPRREWSLDLHVAHVQHHLRDEAEEDAAFVAALAAASNLPHHRRDIHPASAGGNLESAARHDRYEALLEIAESVRADAVVTAHHADDQLETLLMRLIRGSSARGMSGMRPRRRLGDTWLLRPLLWATREEIRTFLIEHGQTWREDHTNDDVSRTRALLRARVLPVLRHLRSDAARKAGDTAERLAEAAHLVNDAATRAAARICPAPQTIHRAAARRIAKPLVAEVVRMLLRAVGVCDDAVPARTLQQIASTILDRRGDVRTFHLAGHARLIVESETVRVERIARPEADMRDPSDQ